MERVELEVGSSPLGWEKLRCRGVNGESLVIMTKVNAKKPPSFPSVKFRRNDLKKPKFFLALLFLSILSVLYLFLVRQNISEVKQRTVDTEFQITMDSNARMIGLELHIISVDLLESEVEAQISFHPSLALGKNHARLNTPVFAYLGYYQKSHNINDTMSPIQTTFPIISGSTSYYPFDSFYIEIAVEFTDLKEEKEIPAQVSLKASIPSLMFTVIKPTNELSKVDNLNQSLRLSIERPITVSVFSVFIVCLMWILSLMLLTITINVAFISQNHPGVSYLGLGTSLLFALPKLRSTQPGIPPIGIVIDAVGFFWDMIIVAMCTVLNLLVWASRRHTDKRIG